MKVHLTNAQKSLWKNEKNKYYMSLVLPRVHMKIKAHFVLRIVSQKNFASKSSIIDRLMEENKIEFSSSFLYLTQQ
jgi:hypothetical protein